MGFPLKNWKEDRTTTNETGFSNNPSRSMSSPSFIEFGQPPFPRSDTLSQSGPLNLILLMSFLYLQSRLLSRILKLRNIYKPVEQLKQKKIIERTNFYDDPKGSQFSCDFSQFSCDFLQFSCDFSQFSCDFLQFSCDIWNSSVVIFHSSVVIFETVQLWFFGWTKETGTYIRELRQASVFLPPFWKAAKLSSLCLIL